MMTRNVISTLIFGGAFTIGSSNLEAQSLGLEYTTEWQTDFAGGYDWLNLLSVSAEIPIHGDFSFEATTISAAKTCETTLLDDILTYSNIEAGNMPLTFARLGFGWSVRSAEFFAGINNVNEDYFTSDLTSFFTNSSFGISPTISCNYDIANYPLAAWCLHYRQRLGSLAFQTSLYPGRGYQRVLGHDNLFSLDIKRDGIFSITSIDYKRNGIYTVLGLALHHGVCIDDANGEPTEAPTYTPEKRFSASPWLLTEISLPRDVGLVAQGSVSTVRSGCKAYAGLGLIYGGMTVQPGLAFNYASFSAISEYSVEISCRFHILTEKAYLQPTVHWVSTDHGPLKCIGMLRFHLPI